MKELNYKTIHNYLSLIYKDFNTKEIDKICQNIKTLFSKRLSDKNINQLWTEKDSFLITYADTVRNKSQNHLKTLGNFLNLFCKDFSHIHILPYYPSSSDDGFAVIDYKRISKENGTWADFEKLTSKFKIMSDLVINHCSSESNLFKNFLKNQDPGSDFFISSKKKFDNFKKVVRPRSSELSKKVRICGKESYVWCTFSHDQVDLNFKNPNVLIFFLEIIKFYIDKGSRALRLDAVAFLWKEKGTKCINQPETHLIIRLIRLIIEYYSNECLVITETNIPSHENLSYFGNNNEAHCIYNFSLAPLLIHAIISEDNNYLKKWSRSMPPAQFGNAYLNFLSTHDGIGMRPLEGILPNNELNKFISTLKKSGAYLTHRVSQNKKTVYEVNTTLLDAFKETYSGEDNFQIKRFILAHEILFAMEGIPAIYIQNLVGSKNDYKKVKKTNVYRSINRKEWTINELLKLLNKNSINKKIYLAITKLIKIRGNQKAFHPNATQFTLQLHQNLFGIWRQSLDRSQSIFCINNLSCRKQTFSLLDINLISTNKWYDLLTKKSVKDLTSNITLMPYQSVWLTNKNK